MKTLMQVSRFLKSELPNPYDICTVDLGHFLLVIWTERFFKIV